MVVRPGFEPTMSMRESINAESANESSSAFEQDSFVLETKISRLEQEVTKSLNEIAKVFEMKYRDCVPQFLALADCQEKIDSSLYSANRKMENLQASLTTAEANMSQLADEDPTKKLIVVRGLINRLGVLDEMEKQLNALWLGASNGENRDCLTDATIITRLEEIVNSMENDEFSEAVNDRILPLIFSEIASRKSELEIVLEDFYKNFLQFPDVERVNPGTEEMVVTCPNPSLISDNLSAMNKLGSFSHKLGSFVEAVWKMFIMRIIQSTEPKSVVTYRCGEFNDIFTFSVTKPKSIATKREGKPADVFGALKEFFQNFHRALKHIHVSGTPFVAHFGKQVACRLVNSLVHDCFKPAIPSDAKDSGELKERTKHLYEDIVNHSSEFLKFMQDNHFFTETTVSFDDFLSDYERIFVDRRCQFFVSHARVLITQPYINLKEVGSCESEDEEKIGDIGRLMEERLKLNKESLETILRGPESDKYSTKLFQFQKCKVSTSTFDFVNLLQDILLEAAKAETEIESARLFTTARNLIEIFISLAPLHHQQAITTVPQIAAVFFNNCHYICHRLITIKADLQQTAADAAKQMNTECNFAAFFTDLRTIAANIIEQHITQARRQISATIGANDVFVDLREDVNYKQCERVLNASAMQIGQVANVWREVMSEFVLTHSLGCLVSHLLTILSDIILAKQDIKASDADIMVRLLTDLMERLKDILTINHVEVIHRVCEEPYFKMTEIIFCLNASLAEIGHRWCEGKGPLAMWLKPEQVTKLVKALFQNTERRRELLSHIN